MFRDVEKIKKDIELLGIEGGYNVDQLLTPQDCRTLSQKIDDLQARIDKAIKFINTHDLYHPTNEVILLSILKGSDNNV